MKVVITLLVLFFSTSLLSKEIIYHCDMNVVFKSNFDSDWSNKNKVMTFTINNKKIKIYDHDIKLTYYDELNVFYQRNQIIASQNDSSHFQSFAIDTQTGQGTYSISWYKEGAGEYMTGKCYKQ